MTDHVETLKGSTGAGPVVRFGRSEQGAGSPLVWVVYEALAEGDFLRGTRVASFVRHKDAVRFMTETLPPSRDRENETRILEENKRLRESYDPLMRERNYISESLLDARARIDAALALHHEQRVYDECDCPGGHAEEDAGAIYIEDDGYITCEKGYRYSICFDCHTDDGACTEDSPTEQAWPCRNVKALRGPQPEVKP